MRKPTICIGANKDADQHHRFHYTNRTLPPFLKSGISSFSLSSVAVQLGLCRTRSKTHCWFSHETAKIKSLKSKRVLISMTLVFIPTNLTKKCPLANYFHKILLEIVNFQK